MQFGKGFFVFVEVATKKLLHHREVLFLLLWEDGLKLEPWIQYLVSSIRESRSDEKRFSIFTSTKRLHLRAGCREGRAAWMDALQAVKDMFPRMSTSELLALENNFAVSTEKLKYRLQEEGVSEAAIQDCEQIMRMSLQNYKASLCYSSINNGSL